MFDGRFKHHATSRYAAIRYAMEGAEDKIMWLVLDSKTGKPVRKELASEAEANTAITELESKDAAEAAKIDRILD